MKRSPHVLFGALVALLFSLLPRLAAQSINGTWTDRCTVGSEEHFLYTQAVARFDLNSRGWKSQVNLPRSGALALVADDQSAFVAYGNSIYRYNPSYGAEELFFTVGSAVDSLFLDGNLLIAVHPSESWMGISIFDRVTKERIDHRENVGTFDLHNAAHSPKHNAVMGTTDGWSPAQVTHAYYTDEGKIIKNGDDPYHGNYAVGDQSFILESQGVYAHNRGILYSTDDSTYLGTLDSSFTDIVSYQENWIITLHEDRFSIFTRSLEKVADLQAPRLSEAMKVVGDQLVVFRVRSTNPISASVLSLSTLIPTEDSGNPAAFTPISSFVEDDGTLAFHSPLHEKVLRWSTDLRDWVEPIQLQGSSRKTSYVPGQNLYHLLTSTGQLFAFPQEDSEAIANLPTSSRANAVLSDGRIAYSLNSSIVLLSPEGEPLTRPEGSYSPYIYQNGLFQFDPATERIYYNTSSSIAAVSLTPNNGFAQEATGASLPYEDRNNLFPFHFSPDGSRILASNGLIFETKTLSIAARLPEAVSDAIWSGDSLITLREEQGDSMIERWQGLQYLPAGKALVNGTPHRLTVTGEGIWVATQAPGTVRMALLDAGLETTFVSPAPPAAPTGPFISGRSHNSATLNWADSSDNESAFRVEYRTGSSGNWTALADLPAGTTSATIVSLQAVTDYEVRVTSIAGTNESAPSDPVGFRTLTVADEPPGEPYNLRATRATSTEITLAWSDNADSETGFQITRTDSSGGNPVRFDVPADTTEFNITGLTSGTIHRFSIQIIAGRIRGETSDPVAIRTNSASSLPSFVRSIEATRVEAEAVTIRWTDTQLNLDGYIIERKHSDSNEWEEIARIGHGARTYTDTTMRPGETYSYRTTAFNEAGSGQVYYTTTVDLPTRGGEFLELTARHSGIEYFAFSGPSRIERYDTEARNWLAPLPLELPTTAIWADTAGLYVATNHLLIFYPADGSDALELVDGEERIDSIVTLGEHLVVSYSSGNSQLSQVLDKLDGSEVNTFEFRYSLRGLSTVPGSRRILGRNRSVSPLDIFYLELNADGSLLEGKDSPYHGDYPAGSRTFTFPDGLRVADDSGIVYFSSDLTFSNSLGGSFTDLAFRGSDIPLLLREDKLLAFTNTFLETGSLTLDEPGLRLAVDQQDVLVFSLDAASTRGLSLTVVPLSEVKAPEPGEAIDPRGLAFVPDDHFVDKDGILHLLSRTHLSLFRWSPVDRDWLPTIPVLDAPSFVTYSEENHSIYLAYPSQVVRTIDLATSPLREVPLFNTAAPLHGLAAVGRNILAADATGAWNTHYIYGPDGTLLDSEDWNRRSSVYAWDPVNSRAYFFRDGTSPNDLHYEVISDEGLITEEGETPYHGDFSAIPPISVSPDGTKVLIGGGNLFEAEGMNKIGSLANGIDAAVWLPGALVTLQEFGDSSQLQFWNPSSFIEQSEPLEINGAPVALHPYGDGLMAVTQIADFTRITILDAGGAPLFSSPTPPLAPASLVSLNRETTRLIIGWTDNSDNESGFRLEYRIAGTEEWNAGPNFGSNTTSGTIDGLTIGTDYEVRLIAVLNELESVPSEILAARTLAHPNEPVGEPYHLTISRVFHNRITIEWQDNSDSETGFRVLRSTNLNGPFTEFNLARNSTNFTDVGLSASTIHYYRVQAFRSTIDGDLSDLVSAGTHYSSSAKPTVPADLELIAAAPGSITFGWTDKSLNEDGFIIERAPDQSPLVWEEVGRTSFNTTQFTDTSVVPGAEYRYRSVAYNSSGRSNDYYNLRVAVPRRGGTYLEMSSSHAGVDYFAFSDPNRIERYDSANRSWLAPIPLEVPAAALHVSARGAYVGQGRSLLHIPAGASNSSVIANLDDEVDMIFSVGDLMIFGSRASGSETFEVINVNSGARLAPATYRRGLTGFSVHPTTGRIYGRSTGVSPSDIHYLDFLPDGTFVGGTDSFYHGDFPNATTTYVTPDGRFVADNSGTVYTSDELVYSHSFGLPFADLAFAPNGTSVVVRDSLLTAYGTNFVEQGFIKLDHPGFRLSIDQQDALVYSLDAGSEHGISVASHPLDAIKMPSPDPAPDARDLAFTPDHVFVTEDKIIHLLSKAHKSILRWSVEQRDWLPGIPLLGAPTHVSYSSAHRRIYLVYSSQVVRYIGLDDPNLTETSHFHTPTAPHGLAATGDFLLMADNSGAWNTHYIYDKEGALRDFKDWNHKSAHYTWDPVKSRAYFFRDNQSPNDLHYEVISDEGLITEEGESPYHGDFTATGPIRVTADGERIAIGSGVVFNASDMTELLRFTPNSIDIQWLDSGLTSIRPLSTNATSLQRMAEGSQALDQLSLAGSPLTLLKIGPETLAVVTLDAERPRFHIVEAGATLDNLFDSSPMAPSIAAQAPSSRVPFNSEIKLRVEAIGSADLKYQWYHNGRLLRGATSAELLREGVGSDEAGEYFIRISNSNGSIDSEIMQVGVGPDRDPLFTRGNLMVGARDKVYEMDGGNTIVREIEVPMPPQITSRTLADLVVDSFGSLHVLQVNTLGSGISRYQVYVSSWEPGIDSWRHTLLNNYQFVSNFAFAELVLHGEQLLSSFGVLDLRDYSVSPPLFRDSFHATGHDGSLLTMTSNGVITRHDPETLEELESIDLGQEVRSLASAPDGTLAIGRSDGPIGILPPTASTATWSADPAEVSFLLDLSLAPDGRIAAGFSGQGKVVLSNLELARLDTVTVPDLARVNTFTCWVPDFDTPGPGFVVTSNHSTLEDSHFEIDLPVEHPDPDARITYSPRILPRWLTLTPDGRLFGQPDAPEIGITSVRIRATDQFNVHSETDLMIEVIEVNDIPFAVPINLTRDEDSVPFEVDLGEAFSDEETDDKDLSYRILGDSNPGIIESKVVGTTLHLSCLQDIFGATSLTIEARDEGGATITAPANITIRPVNDPPVFATSIPDIDAGGPADNAFFDLGKFVFDADPEEILRWKIISISNRTIFSSVTIDEASGRLDIDYAPWVSGESVIEVEVSDDDDTSARFKIPVRLPDLPLPQLTLAEEFSLNRQTGLYEHHLTVDNPAAREIAGFDLTITGLPEGVCVNNASDCQGTEWIVQHRQTLAAGESVTLIIEYFAPVRGTVLEPEVAIALVLEPEVDAIAGDAAQAVDRCMLLEDGLLIEFTSKPNALYEIHYSHNATEWKVSPTRIRAAGNRVQWIDRGPPRTDSLPSNKSSRFYRVRELSAE